MTSSIDFMHFAAFLRNALFPLPVIIFVPTTAAAVPTAKPMPIPFAMDIFFDDEYIIIPPLYFLGNILTSVRDKKDVNFFKEVFYACFKHCSC